MSPKHHSHIFGFVIRQLRTMYLRGESAQSMMSYLRAHTGDHWHLAYRYMRQAFCQKTNVFTYILPPGPVDAATEQGVRRYIEETRSEWEHQRWPELPRLRDYFSFLEFARDEHLFVVVCDVPPGTHEYRLHGVYDADSGETAWTARRGEKLRAAINRRLGRELVLRGPLDDQEQRGGPQVPAISFDHEQGIHNHLRARDLQTAGPYRRHWERLYLDHPVRS